MKNTRIVLPAILLSSVMNLFLVQSACASAAPIIDLTGLPEPGARPATAVPATAVPAAAASASSAGAGAPTAALVDIPHEGDEPPAPTPEERHHMGGIEEYQKGHNGVFLEAFTKLDLIKTQGLLALKGRAEKLAAELNAKEKSATNTAAARKSLTDFNESDLKYGGWAGMALFTALRKPGSALVVSLYNENRTIITLPRLLMQDLAHAQTAEILNKGIADYEGAIKRFEDGLKSNQELQAKCLAASAKAKKHAKWSADKARRIHLEGEAKSRAEAAAKKAEEEAKKATAQAKVATPGASATPAPAKVGHAELETKRGAASASASDAPLAAAHAAKSALATASGSPAAASSGAAVASVAAAAATPAAGSTAAATVSAVAPPLPTAPMPAASTPPAAASTGSSIAVVAASGAVGAAAPAPASAPTGDGGKA